MNCTCPRPQTSSRCTCLEWATYLHHIQNLPCTCNNHSASYPSSIPPLYEFPNQNFTSLDYYGHQQDRANNKRTTSKLSMISDSDHSTGSYISDTPIDKDLAEQLRNFYRQTNEHRHKIKEERDIKSRVQLEKINYEMNDHVDRKQKLEVLYGPYYEDAASLEAVVSLRYETYCDENQPILWPVLPLKL